MPTSPVLDSLTPAVRRTLSERGVPRQLAAGETLLLAGDTTSRIWILEAGVIKLVARDTEGRETILGLALPGALVGDVAALDGLPQALDAIAAVRSRLMALDKRILMEALSQSPEAAFGLAIDLARRIRWLWEATHERTSGEVPARLAGRLLDLAGTLGRMNGEAIELDLPLPQEDLGRLAGMCRESACKTLRRFKAQGLVEYRGRRLRILSPEGLRRIHCARLSLPPHETHKKGGQSCSSAKGPGRRSRSPARTG